MRNKNKKGQEKMPRMIMNSSPEGYNTYQCNNYINFSEEDKKEKGLGGMAKPNKRLIPSSNNYNVREYLNISVDYFNSRAGMAEWSTQLVDTQWSSFGGSAGSIPVPGAALFN